MEGRRLFEETKQPEGCFWRLLLPTFVAAPICFLIGAPASRSAPRSVFGEPQQWFEGALGMGLFVVVGILLVALPGARLIRSLRMRFEAGFLLLVAVCAVGGPLVLLLVFLPALIDGGGVLRFVGYAGAAAAFCGGIAGAVWATINHDLLRPPK